MCGIVGIWNFYNQELEERKLIKFTDALFHRGPDGSGYQLLDNNTLGFGHRRLSILDLSDAAKQPMSYENERYWITYNGEIFNFLEIKKELSIHGYLFKTSSDTEVLIAAYDKWGKDCLKKFNGMWAFAIWDNSDKSLFIARDRFGVKPLYYSLNNNCFYFASETIAFNSIEGFKKELNDELFLRSIINPRSIEASGFTFYKTIKQLTAGSYIHIKKNDPIIEKRWWNTFDNLITPPVAFEKQVETFRDLFEDACKIRLRSDVSIASALSGGLDSSSVYCMVNHLMKKQSNHNERTPADWQKAFVAIFPGTPQDEYEYAKQVIDYTKGDVKYIEPDFSLLPKEIIEATIKFDSITGTPINTVATIYKAMRKNKITVSLDGHGADELMYGYTASVADAYYDAYSQSTNNQDDLLNTYLLMFLPELRLNAKDNLLKRANTIKKFDQKQNGFFGKIKKTLIKKNPLIANYPGFIADEWLKSKAISEMKFNKMDFKKLSRGEEKLANDFHLNEIPYNLRDFDRASMQHGIEIRMPFMDYRLVTYLFSLPQQSKLGKGYTKLVLREAMKGLMPEPIRTRTHKIGLSAPITNWFNGPLGSFICDEVNSKKFLDSNYWNGELIRTFVAKKVKEKSWKDGEAEKFWNVLNAHILLAYGN